MPLKFVESDILKIPADIIVNPSDGRNFSKSKVSQAIQNVAGKEYSDIIAEIQPFRFGNVQLSESGNLLYQYVAHTALPHWQGGDKNEREYIDSCYSEVLYMADEEKCKSVVFPLLGVGLFGTPIKEAINIAIRAIESYLTIKDSLTVFVAILDEEASDYVKKQYPTYWLSPENLEVFDATNSLDYKLSHMGYKFIESLTYYMNRQGCSSVQCYTAAGVDKKLFSKIKNNESYLPGKSTIIKFAIALHLSLKETQQLLGTCGYVLSDSIKQDVIIKHFLTHRLYDFEKIKEELNKRSL